MPGVIGMLQALEAIKIIVGLHGKNKEQSETIKHKTHIRRSQGDAPPNFLVFNGASSDMFRTIRMRKKKKDCPVCGDNPTIKALIDYVEFCGSGATDKVISHCLSERHKTLSVYCKF